MSDQDDISEGGEQRHQPKQSRSQETWNAILEAAAETFAEQGYEQTTTHHVAERAGVSVGALYRYFANKEALVVELYRRYVSELRDRLVAEFPIADIVGGSDVRELVRKTLALAFRLYSERPGLRRVLVEQARKIPELVELRLEQEAEIRLAVGQILGAFPGARLPDTEVGAYLIRLFIESLIDDFLLYRPEDADFDEERLIDAAADFILRYVTGRVG